MNANMNVVQSDLRCDLTIFFLEPCDCLFNCCLLWPFACVNHRVISAIFPYILLCLCQNIHSCYVGLVQIVFVKLPTTEKSYSFSLLRHLSSIYYSCFSLAELNFFIKLKFVSFFIF